MDFTRTVKTLRNLIETNGSSAYHGEDVSQLEHAFQSYKLAEQAGADKELQIASFLHDIGHLLGEEVHEFGAKNHDRIGAEWLRAHGFSERVAQVSENHVNAKRYLCLKNSDYFNKLSHASVESLKRQGGVMNESEAVIFEQNPYFMDIIQARLWDEEAKDVDFMKPDIEEILVNISQYLEQQ